VGEDRVANSRRRPLARKFALAFVGLVTGVLLLNGAMTLWLAWQESERATLAAHQDKAAAAAERIIQFIGGIERELGWTTRIEWSGLSLEQRRYDFIRLLRQTPAITEVIQLDGAGKERLRLSRLEPDSVDSGTDRSQEPYFKQATANQVWYGPVYFRRGSEPYMTLAVAHAGRSSGVTVAEVNLKLIWDVILAIRVGEHGLAYITDARGRLVAHPDIGLVLRDTDMAALPQVAAAISAAHQANGGGTMAKAVDLNGQPELSAHAPIPAVGWLVFVEQPVDEALAPIHVALERGLLLLAVALIVAIGAGAWLGRRMAVPIRQLAAGAKLLGEGDLAHRIAIRSGDEIETLADRFNVMASHIQESYATLEAKVEARTRELSRSLEDLRTTQHRLVQSEKLASLGQLTAGIAHEIKNPLNFVNNFAGLSVELVDELRTLVTGSADSLNPAVRAEIDEVAALLRSNLEKIKQHGQRADSIVKNMLLHSRQDGGERRSVDLNAMVEESLNLAFHGARAERPGFNIDLVRQLDPTVGALEIYPQELTRVLLNLFSNGFYATHARKEASGDPGFKPTLTVTTRVLGERVEIRVHDNGTGIPDSVKAQIFNPFFTTKPAGEGTGLGLSISYDIVVKQHGGMLDVETMPGQFTEFILSLPRSRSSEQAA
jgi:two-component system NtrC family sensor kinase